jgi:hypothetical protein
MTLPECKDEVNLEDECGIVLYGPDGKVKETRKRKHKNSLFVRVFRILVESIIGKEEEENARD